MSHLKTLVFALWLSSVAAFSAEKPSLETPSRRSLIFGGAAAALVTSVVGGSAPANAALGAGTPVGREIGQPDANAPPSILGS